MSAPTTAAQARALADQLAAKEDALAKSQRAARRASDFLTWEASLDDVGALTTTVAAAQAAWDAAAADPSIGLDGLFVLWQNLRTASATRARLVSTANAGMTGLRPLKNEHSGQPQGYRHDTQDAMALVQFQPALEAALTARITKVADDTVSKVRTRVTTEGEKAASKATTPK